MLGYGLVFGTILLSCMLFKTCAIDTHPRQNRRMMNQEMIDMHVRTPLANQNTSKNEIRQEIAYHENQIQKLKHLER